MAKFIEDNNAMVRLASTIFGFLFTFPFILMTYLLMVIAGKKRAIKTIGKLVTKAAALGMSCLVPRIKSPQDYSLFQKAIKRNFLFVGPIYDLLIEKEAKDVIEFRVQQCSVSKAFKKFGLPELCKYSCAGDWVVAKNNRDFWSFSREQTIGTGGKYCNHTYSRKDG